MATWYQGDGFQLKWPYPLKAVRSLRIDRKFNEHATCSFTAMMAEEDAEACIRNGSFEDSLMIRKPGEVRDEHWFAGGITSIDIQMEDGIPHVQIEAISRTYAMDMKPVSRSYQNKGLTYTEVIGQLSEKYPKGDAQNVATNPGDSIGELIVQYQETDWQFMKRLASRIGTVILPDVVMDAARVYFGVPDLSWGTVIKSKRYAMIRNCDTYMEIKAHAEGGSADAMRVTDFTSYRVVTEQYCQVGDDVQFKGSMWVVSESVITYQNGMLQYEYLLVQRQSLRRKARLNKAIQGVSLEGRVVKRANNMVKVHLDIDDGHDEQGNWWFPYSPEGNNIFHCLPDEGARIKVYFPSGKEKKAIAVNAVRGGSEEMKAKKVFQKPTTKVFEMPSNAKMELGEDGVLFKQGTVSFHMDQNNIRVKASEDLLVVASNNLNLSGSGAVIDSIKMEATSIAMQTKLDQYIYIEGNQVRIKGNVIRFDKVQKDFMELLTDEDLKELYIEQEVEAEMEKGEERTLLGATIQVPLPESQRGEVRTRIAEKVSNDPHASTKARDAIGKLDEKTLKESYQARFSPAAPSKSDDETAAEQEAYKRSYDAYNIGKQEQFLGVVPHAANGIPAAPVQPNKASPMEQIGKGLLNEMALNMVIPQMPDYYSKRMIETPLHYSRFTFQKFVIDPQMQMAELSFLFGAVAIVLVIPTGGTSMYLLAAAEVFLGVAGMVVSTQKMNDLKDGKAFTDPTFLGLNQRTIDILGVGMAGVALLSLMKHGVMKVANKLSNSKQITALDELEGLQRMTGGDIQVAPPASGKAAGKADGKQAGKLPPASGKLGSKTPEINAAPKVVPPKVLPGKAGSEGPLQKTRPEPVDDSKTSIMKETIRTRVLRNIANSKKARDASNFDVYLRNEKVLFDKIKGKNKLKENATGTDGSGNVPKRYGEPPVETKLKIDIAAEKKAELIRVSGLDNIEVFAKNTGLSIEEAKNLKSHMFLNEYELCHFDQQGLYYYKSRLTPDSEVVYAFTKAQEGELTQQGKEWFKKLAAHELAEKKLMESGLNYRHPDSWDGMKFTSDPPGAHDLAPKQPEFGSFPGYEEDVAKFYNIKWRELYD